MPGISGSCGGSSDSCSVRAIAERCRCTRAESTATAARRPSSSSTVTCSGPSVRPDSAVESVITPTRWPRTVIGTLAFERAPICSIAARCAGLRAAAR
jgi:hypothetical protein